MVPTELPIYNIDATGAAEIVADASRIYIYIYMGEILDKCPIAEKPLHILSIAHDPITVDQTVV